MANDGIMRGSYNPDTGFGAQGDDSKVWATFYNRAMIDGVASKAAGRTITTDVPHVKIIQPGESRLSVYDQPATNDDAARFPRQWEAFKAGAEQTVAGSPLSLLFPQSPATVDNLNRCGIRTVEMLATANDAALQEMGMGARSFQEKAKTYLAQADKGKDFHGLSDRVDQLALQAKEKDDRIAALEAALAEATVKRGPGRPRSDAA